MKRIFAFFLSLLLILGICPMSALADTGGSGNVDGGGGSMGQGTSQNSWNPGMDGVRVTVIYSETQKPASASIDLTSKTPAIKIHFGRFQKSNIGTEALSLRQQVAMFITILRLQCRGSSAPAVARRVLKQSRNIFVMKSLSVISQSLRVFLMTI